MRLVRWFAHNADTFKIKSIPNSDSEQSKTTKSHSIIADGIIKYHKISNEYTEISSYLVEA